ncbi:lantibiotic dehydratase [Nocardiopsis xinjiangensis]|uniref:lantibiotic dehydratase n=1 Tax=Nocardiopsis xinjiangensis TaxID=124285 RepID=UPI0003464FBF|nr:lantibiotic dehydratase [Nocardiopsis xinjiangensis]
MEFRDLPETVSFLAPSLAVRVSNIPVERLEELRFVHSMELVERILDTEDRLTATGQKISDGLYPVIGDPVNAEIKPLLVALRRAVHGNRLPAPRTRDPKVLAAVPEHLHELLRTWLEDLERRRTDYADLPELLAEERTQKYPALRKAVADPAFQHGLIQGSPVLFQRLRAWLTAESENEPDRKIALRAVKYLARVVAKTSPYSTFVSAGTLPLEPGPRRPGTENVEDGSIASHQHSVLELNTWISDRIHSALWQQGRMDPDTPLRLNPSAVILGEHVIMLVGEKGREAVRAIAAAPAVLHVIDDLTRAGPIPRSDLTSRLEAVSGQESSGGQFVQQVISAGLLEPCPPRADQDPVPAMDTEPSGQAEDPTLGSVLGELDTLMSVLPRTAEAEARSERLREIHTVLGETFTRLGLDPAALPPKNAVHETALLTEVPPALKEGRWEEIRPDLDSVRRFTALFRPDLPFKLACAHFFAEHYPRGRQVPFMEFYRDAIRSMNGTDTERTIGSELAAHLSGPFGPQWDLQESTVPALEEVAELRDRARSSLLNGPTGEHGIHLERSALNRISAQWPGHVRAPESVSFYLQLLPGPSDGTGPLAVMNECATGYGRGRRRLDGLLRGRSEAPYAPQRYRHRDLVLAECDANFGHRLNVRPPATDHCIDYPGSFSDRPGERRIPLSELVVESDPASGLLQLRSPRIGLPVRPLHLGLLGDFLLPSAFAFLIKAFGEPPSLIYQAWSPFVDMTPWADGGEPDGVLEAPRVTVGGLVVARKTHYVHARNFPVRKKGADDAAHVVRLISWLREHGLPRRCFVRVLNPEWRSGRGSALTKARKPMYVDFDNMFLSASLERAITSDDDLVILQEAVPDPREAPYLGAERYTTEYVAELSDGASLE